jgi:hypothetical protein
MMLRDNRRPRPSGDKGGSLDAAKKDAAAKKEIGVRLPPIGRFPQKLGT